jgi:putative ABC transport system permease protein
MGNSPNITFVDSRTVFSGSTLTIFAMVAIPVLLVIGVLLSNFGLKLRAIGYNKKFAAISGINVRGMIVIGLILSNALIALGGSLFCQYQSFCDVSCGTGMLVVGLTSVVIGEKVLPFKKEAFIVASCVIGSVLYRIFISIALHSGVFGLKTQDLNLITGIVIVAVMVVKRRGRKNVKRR